MTARKTGLLLPPTMEEIKLVAAKMGLPEIEAEKFWHFYESKGWVVGKVRMVSFVSSLALWNINWRERTQKANGHTISHANRSVKDILARLDKGMI